MSFAFLKCADIVHFRHLLSPKTKLVWRDDWEQEFCLAKASIVQKIHKGVTMFKVDCVADYFFGCDKLYVGTDHKHLLAFFRKDDPKPLDHIVNKRIRKYVSEIGELRFSIFHIPGANNFLSGRGSRFPTGKAGYDRGDDLGSASDLGSAKKVVAASVEIQANTMGPLPPYGTT